MYQRLPFRLQRLQRTATCCDATRLRCAHALRQQLQRDERQATAQLHSHRSAETRAAAPRKPNVSDASCLDTPV